MDAWGRPAKPSHIWVWASRSRCLIRIQEIAGSNPATQTRAKGPLAYSPASTTLWCAFARFSACSAVGSVLRSDRRSRGFESLQADNEKATVFSESGGIGPVGDVGANAHEACRSPKANW